MASILSRARLEFSLEESWLYKTRLTLAIEEPLQAEEALASSLGPNVTPELPTLTTISP